ncbi:unnamed protein product [Cunninghamella blakesleeana]
MTLYKVITKYFYDSSKKVPLYLRKFTKVKDGNFWYDYKSDNIFLQELCDQYLVIAVPLDVGVMVFAKDVKILKLQEDQHAMIHTNTMKTHEAARRYDGIKRFLKFLVMKSPEIISINILGNIEASFGHSMYISQRILGPFWSNILVFHWYEESEHGMVTTQHFKEKYNIIIRFLLFPLGILVLACLWFLPIIMKLLDQPTVLLKPSTYVYLFKYVFMTLIVVPVHIIDGLFLWVLPFKRPLSYYNTVKNAFDQLMTQRKIEFDIIDKDSYHF